MAKILNSKTNVCVPYGTADGRPTLSVVGEPPTNFSTGCDPTEEETARLAYFHWEARLREGHPGSAEEDWFRAEADLRLQYGVDAEAVESSAA